MKRQISYFIFWLLLLMPLSARAEVLIEAVVAVLSFENGEPLRKVVYLSDLERHRLFFENSEDIFIEVKDGEDFHNRRPLIRRRDAVIHQALFLREALRFAIKKPEEAEILVALQKIRQRFQTGDDFENALKKSALSLSELKEKIALYLWVEQLIQERIQEFIFIGPKAIEAYQLAHLNDFIGQQIETIEKNITRILSFKKAAEKKQTYLKRLKEKIQIELILSEDAFPSEALIKKD